MDKFFAVYSTVMFIGGFVFWILSRKHLTTAKECLEDAQESLDRSSALRDEAISINDRSKQLMSSRNAGMPDLRGVNWNG